MSCNSLTLMTRGLQVTQSVQTGGFDAPFFIMWFSTNFQLLCFPVAILHHLISRKAQTQAGPSLRRLGINLPIHIVLTRAPFFWLLWAGANYMYVRALGHSSATVVTAVFSICPALVWVLSKVFLSEPTSLTGLVAVFFSVGGVVLICAGQGLTWADLSNDAVTGELLTFGAACLAATYKAPPDPFSASSHAYPPPPWPPLPPYLLSTRSVAHRLPHIPHFLFLFHNELAHQSDLPFRACVCPACT